MRTKQHILSGVLIVLMILENLFLYYFHRHDVLSQGKNAIGLFLSSALFGIVLIYKFYNADAQVAPPRPAKNNIISYSSILLVVLGLVMLGVQNNGFFNSFKIDYRNSDIIPLIQVLCRRVLNGGQFAYDTVLNFGYPLKATYLPAQWLPYTFAELLHIDYRWISYGAWCLAAIWLCIRSSRVSSPVLRAVIPLLILASYYVLHINSIGILEMTVEVLISAYYMMLIIGINQNSGILLGIVTSLCLLSRYSLVLWLPLYCFILFTTNNRKQLYIAAITATIVVTIMYIIPFLSKDWTIFYKGYKYYDSSAYWEWTHLNEDPVHFGEQGKPIHLFSGTGFAYYFYTRFSNLDVMSRIKLLQRTHLICSLLVTVIMGAWFWFKREKINGKIFTLASFKIYLAVFLFLIQVPYEYLMCVGNFVSIAIFCEQARYVVTPKTAVPST